MGWEDGRGVESDGVEFVERGIGGWEGWGEGVVWELSDGDGWILRQRIIW